jgi:hypothetical protein
LIAVTLNPTGAGDGADVAVRVEISGNTGEISAFGLDLAYDPAMFTFKNIAKGTLTGNWAVVGGRVQTAGALVVGGYRGGGTKIPASSSGTVVIVTLTVNCPSCTAGQTSDIQISDLVDDIAALTPSPGTATFTFRAGPQITTHPQSQLIMNGQSVNLTVVASGTPPLHYQWYRGARGDTTLPVGTDSSSYTTPALRETTSYWVRVSNALGQTDSNAAVLTLIIPRIQLNRTHLYFGCANGVFTSAQNVLVTNSGTGTLHWTAHASNLWLTAAPAGATGDGIVSVGVSPAGLAPGTYTGTVSIVDLDADNSPQVISVALKVYAAGTAPFGSFDTPAEGAAGIVGAIPVTGWVLDDIEAKKVEIWRDPVLSAGEVNSRYFIGAAIFVEGARPDVEASYPSTPLGYRAGWGYMLLTNFLPGMGNGTYKLYAIATDAEGHALELGSKTITCDNAHAAKPFGTIDTPAQGGTASGNPFLNFGWVLTPLPATVPKDGSTIQVYVDSVPVGSLNTPPNVYNQFRQDVADNFPGLNNSSGPVGAFFLDTTAYGNGVHTIFWIAYDDLVHGEGIGSRYFSIVNTSGSPEAGPRTSALRIPETVSDSGGSLRVKRGFGLRAKSEALASDASGVYRLEASTLDLVEIDLGSADEARPGEESRDAGASARWLGFEAVGPEMRPLPVGSTLDPVAGRFSWLPGPGFRGEFELVFIASTVEGPKASRRVKILVRPKGFPD